MADRGPFGPFLPLGRWSPLVGVTALLLTCGVAVTVVILGAGDGCRPSRFGPGSGDGRSPLAPLVVDGPAALAEAARCPDRHLRQVGDIEAPNPWTPLGLGRAGTPAFTGSYDGGGHRLIGVRVFLPGTDAAGVFAIVDGGEIRDLVLEDVLIEAEGQVGAVVGRALGEARVVGITVRAARITGREDVGGLVGVADPSVRIEGEFTGILEVAGQRTPARLAGRITD